MCLQLHRIVQNAADLDHPGFGHAIEQEMTRAVDPAGSSTGRLAAEEEMIGSAIVSDFGAWRTPGKFRIRADLFNSGGNEGCVTFRRLWTKILLGPSQNADDVAAGFRSDDDWHRLTGRSWQILNRPRLRFP